MLWLWLAGCAKHETPNLFPEPIPRNEILEFHPLELRDGECERWRFLAAGEASSCSGLVGPVNGPIGHTALEAGVERARAGETFLADAYRNWETDRARAQYRYQQCDVELWSAKTDAQRLRATQPVVTGFAFIMGALVAVGVYAASTEL